jgi:hypothetical protein
MQYESIGSSTGSTVLKRNIPPMQQQLISMKTAAAWTAVSVVSNGGDWASACDDVPACRKAA